MALEITDGTFEQAVLKSDKPVMLDFWATWCGPCRAIAPTIEALAKAYEGRAVVGKVDIDANEQIPARYGIRNIPTVLFFKNGEVVDKLVGSATQGAFEDKLKALL
ncbi:MAG: thioredoxin [Prevotellaceae bacterium]|jgi:thioredoxin 1|nr:thioredoxin [Prevotellaceae bacterium]